MDSGVSSSDKQHILSPSTPESRHNVRGASGRFGKLSTEKKKPGAQALQKGYKIWTAKRKLSYEDCCEESEPPPKRALRSSQVSNKGCSEYLLFFSSSEDKVSYRSKFKCRSLTSGSDFYQQTTAKNLQGTRLVDVEILAHGLKECSFCKRGKFELFFYNNNSLRCVSVYFF